MLIMMASSGSYNSRGQYNLVLIASSTGPRGRNNEKLKNGALQCTNFFDNEE